MILLGTKKEEYRDLTEHYYPRLMFWEHRERNNSVSGRAYTDFKKFDKVRFSLGYAKNASEFTIECKGIHIGNAKPEWSDNASGEFFVITLGNIIEKKL